MSAITIRPDEARAIMSRLDALNHEQYNAFDRLNKYIAAISSDWSGEIAAAANDRLSRTNVIATTITEEMNDYCNALEYAINELEEADRRAAEQAARDAAIAAGGIGVAIGGAIAAGNWFSDFFFNHGQSGFRIKRSGISTDQPNGHCGYDFSGIGGSQVSSFFPANGKVVQNYYSSSYGNTVMVEYQVNGEYYYTTYAHLQEKSNLAVGASVSQGTIIGKMGTTGSSSGNHLHFDVWQGKNPAQPMANPTNRNALLDRSQWAGGWYTDPRKFFDAVGVQV